jgi:hypothetical protein
MKKYCNGEQHTLSPVSCEDLGWLLFTELVFLQLSLNKRNMSVESHHRETV